ncbi:glycosyltransferase [[Eubacterium] cellulosolvens]
MLTTSALNPNVTNKLKKYKQVDLIIGIPSYNCAHIINYVIHESARGLLKYFPDLKCLILISDGGSTDGTQEVVKAIKLPEKIKKEVFIYSGEPGKGTAIKAIFESVKLLNAKAMAMVDSDLRSIRPQWMKLLIEPVLKDNDLITPFYVRHRYDGTITNFICYPFTSGVYGKYIRQPIGGDFGLSNNLIQKLLESPLWNLKSIAKFGIDIFITHTAIAGGFKIKQAVLGVKLHEAKDPGKHLSPMFNNVVGTMFNCMIHYEDFWRKIKGSKSVPIIQENLESANPEPIRIDVKLLITNFEKGLEKYNKILKSILSPDSYNSIYKNRSKYSLISSEIWPKVSYEMAAAFKKVNDKNSRESLLDIFRTLWSARVADYASKSSGLTEVAAEKMITKNSRLFEKSKKYLLEIF